MTDDYLGLLLAYSCILFLNWYQLGEIPCFKGLRGGWFPRKRDKDFILKLLVRSRNSNQFRTKTQPPKLHKPSESVRPKNFLPIDFWVNYRRTIALFTLYNLG